MNAARTPATKTLSRTFATSAPAAESPWGMVGLIVAAGVGGYVVYEGQQQEARFAELSKKVAFAEKCVVSSAQKKNAAFVFIKPHAVTPKVQELVTSVFEKAGITITKEGDLGYKQIDEEMLIDTHYGAIANRAVKQDPKVGRCIKHTPFVIGASNASTNILTFTKNGNTPFLYFSFIIFLFFFDVLQSIYSELFNCNSFIL